MNVIIYGTSNKALMYLPAIAIKYNVVGFIDSDKSKAGQIWMSKNVYHPSALSDLDFDLIIIASSFVSEIKSELTKYNLHGEIVDDIKEINEIFHEYSLSQIEFCQKIEDSLPKTKLLDKHINQAVLLNDRMEMISLFPKNAVIAELGVAAGDFSKQIFNICKPSKLHLVDVWNSSRYGDESYLGVDCYFKEHQEQGQVVIHRKYSLDALSSFEDESLDIAYIDTTHAYELTKQELILCSKKVKKTGIIAGHDYIQGNWSSKCRYGVIEAVHEFCFEHDYKILFLTMDMSESLSFAIAKI
ncbi:MAG: class I SAM-dependent methyltransferase [Aeromonas sp.]